MRLLSPSKFQSYILCFGESATGNGHINKQERSSYKPRSLTDIASSRKKKDREEPYQTGTVGLVGKERVERNLPLNWIQKTLE